MRQIEDVINLTLEELYSNNQAKLRQICNEEMFKFGGILQKDHDDFYSRAGYDLNRARKKYNPQNGKTPMEYFYGVIKKSVWKEMTNRNRAKRQVTVEREEEDDYGNIVKKKEYVHNISIDTPLDNDSGLSIGDTLQSEFSIEDIFFKNNETDYSDMIKEFIRNLSPMQKRITTLIMKGCKPKEIKNILNITDKQYRDCWNVITSYDKKRILYREDNMEEEKMDAIIEGNVIEKFKNTSFSIESISKQLKKRKIRDNHILQRHSGQWKSFAKSELISDILRGKSLTQIIISEEIKNGTRMQWLIDGKQRCTTLDDYLHDGFAISKNVKNYNVVYPIPNIDDSGKEIFNEEGFPIPKYDTCDIRGKKFSQLPEELQEIFRDRQIPVLYNMNCTKKDIADDIARFNRSRPMNKAQNGWLGLDEAFAELVGNIAKMPFFQSDFEGSNYTNNNDISGAIRRIIVESIMVSDFIDDFSSFDKMCEFLSEEASDSNFTEFYSLVERLTIICNTSEIATLFDAKDSFLWFGLFSRFVKLEIEDQKFANFMCEFGTLRRMKIEGKSFDDILADNKSTKDKSIVIKKMDHLEKLMVKYLDIKKEDIIVDVVEKPTEVFIAELLDLDIEEVKEDLDFYEETLNELEEKSIKVGSNLLDKQNRLSLLAIVVYSFKTDIDLDEWMIEYAKNNNTYFTDQKKNFLHMKKDLEYYCKENTRSA